MPIVGEPVLAHLMFDGLPVYYRPGTSDLALIREVLENKTGQAYHRPSIGCTVEAGEHWLDLGASIGVFAAYSRLRGARAISYEPDPDAYRLLCRNAPGAVCVAAAVTTSLAETVTLYRSNKPRRFSRATLFPVRGIDEPLQVRNVCVTVFETGSIDGIKMDIEGSEFSILDYELLPYCQKLCFEYHLSRDPSMKNLRRRLDYLRRIFENVSYVPELDRLMALGGNQKGFVDRIIFCSGRKG